TWVMRHEFNQVNVWEEWFKEFYLPVKAKQLLIEINDLRIETTKRAGLKTDLFFPQTDLYIDQKYYPELKKLQELEDGDYILSIEPTSVEPKKLDEGTIQFVGKIARTEIPYNDSRQKTEKHM
ncbi:MAG TPA: hypothetical protein VKI61_13475, partial [Chitinophagaceae bacterium]|nr:hypothetical protein [Chitinophagaceae bacterium]